MKNNRTKSLLIIITILIISACSNSTIDLKLIPVKSGDKWGYIDKKGTFVINPQFKSAGLFHDGLALVLSNDEKYGFISEDGKYKINPTYKRAAEFSEGMACVVVENGKTQFIDKNGKTLFTIDCDYAGRMHEGLARISLKNKWGFIDKNGKTTITPNFIAESDFHEGLAAFKQKTGNENKWGFIDKNGKIAINAQFNNVDVYHEGLAKVYDGKKYGFIDKNGKYVINPQFDHVGYFANGFAYIKQGDSYGYIDNTGKIIINPQFKLASSFGDHDLAPVKNSDGQYGLIDKEGKFKVNPQFEGVSKFCGDIAFVASSKKIGLIDKEGKFIVNPQFDDIEGGELFDEKWDEDDYLVKSDYLDINSITESIMVNSSENKFMGMSSENTFSDILKLFPDTKDNNILYSSLYYSKDTSLNINIDRSLLIIRFANVLYSERPIYKTQTYYGYSFNTFDHYEKTYNTLEKVTGIRASYTLKDNANGKGKLVAEALANLIKEKYKCNLTNNYSDNDASEKIQEGKITLKGKNTNYYVTFNTSALQVETEFNVDNSKNIDLNTTVTPSDTTKLFIQ